MRRMLHYQGTASKSQLVLEHPHPGCPSQSTAEVSSNGEIFLARGTGDRLVPKRLHRMCYEALYGFGIEKDRVTSKEYEGMGHVMAGAELRDLCAFLEKVVPEMD